MESALAVRSTPFSELMTQAETLVKSGFLPTAVNSKEKAVAIMTMGQELGIGIWAAFNGISVIQGKPTVGPQLMLALIHRTGQLEHMEIKDDGTTCYVTMKRKGGLTHTSAFSVANATAMGLAGKDNWRKQPAVMRQWRAVGACARIVFPDTVNGFYSPEEINPELDVDPETGEILSAPEYTPPTPPKAAQPAPVVEDGEVVEKTQPTPPSVSETPEPEKHWTETQDWVAFWTYTKNKLDLTREEVHTALAVESVKDFTGSKAESNSILVEASAQKAARLAAENHSGEFPATADVEATEEVPFDVDSNEWKPTFWKDVTAKKIKTDDLFVSAKVANVTEFFAKYATKEAAYKALETAASDAEFEAAAPKRKAA
jgi:hypothetical protein